MSEKPLLRPSEYAAAGRDRGSSYNVVRQGVNLIPDYSEYVPDEEEEDHKKAKPKGSGWWPTFCPCGPSLLSL